MFRRRKCRRVGGGAGLTSSPPRVRGFLPVPRLSGNIFGGFLTRRIDIMRSGTNTTARFLLMTFEDLCTKSFLMLATFEYNLVAPAPCKCQKKRNPRHAKSGERPEAGRTKGIF